MSRLRRCRRPSRLQVSWAVQRRRREISVEPRDPQNYSPGGAAYSENQSASVRLRSSRFFAVFSGMQAAIGFVFFCDSATARARKQNGQRHSRRGRGERGACERGLWGGGTRGQGDSTENSEEPDTGEDFTTDFTMGRGTNDAKLSESGQAWAERYNPVGIDKRLCGQMIGEARPGGGGD